MHKSLQSLYKIGIERHNNAERYEVIQRTYEKMIELIKDKNFDKAISLISKKLKRFYLPKSNYDRTSITPYNTIAVEYFNLKYDYINASIVNYINYNFIPCQLPKKEFVSNFNEMAVKCDLVICLTVLNKDYFEAKNKIEEKIFKRDTKEVFIDELYNIDNKNIRRLRFLCWEDFSVPDFDDLRMFVDHYRKYETSIKNVLVHCLMGVGRTGTFMMYVMLQDMNIHTEEQFGEVFVYLRYQRPCLVYNREQLAFLHKHFIN